MMRGHRSPTPMQPRTPSLPVDPDLPEDGLLVGWSLEAEHQRVPVGFRFAGASSEHRRAGEHLDPILFTAEGHLITIAPTGAGKGIGALIPTLLRHPGQVIVIDPKGENYRVTAAWQTIVNNCKVFQAFGFNTFNAARAAAEAAGHPDPQALFEMDADEMMLMIAGDEPVIAQRPNYLIDAPFAGLFEPNPYHTPDDLDAVTPRLPQREYRRPGAVAEEEPVT